MSRPGSLNKPIWWKWYTRKLEGLVPEMDYEFESHGRHEGVAQERGSPTREELPVRTRLPSNKGLLVVWLTALGCNPTEHSSIL